MRGEKENTPTRVLTYVFTGKLTLFPIVIIFLGFGAGYLLFYGNTSYANGYFQSSELYYGIAGLIVSIIALALLVFLVTWMVLRVSFIITPTSFRILKSGILRSSLLEFDVSKTNLLYYRSHYNENRAWMQLVVQEDDIFYQVFSWKGTGKQKERFLELFKTLRYELRLAQGSRAKKLEYSHIIISREEFAVIGPFSSRYRAILRDRDGTEVDRVQSLCIEDVNLANYDSFFRHFSTEKTLPEHDFRFNIA